MLSVYASPAESDDPADDGPLFIKKNDDVLCKMWITPGNAADDNLGADTNGCSAVAELSPDDSVRVTGNADDTAYINADKGAGFVGHMIQPY